MDLGPVIPLIKKNSKSICAKCPSLDTSNSCHVFDSSISSDGTSSSSPTKRVRSDLFGHSCNGMGGKAVYVGSTIPSHGGP